METNPAQCYDIFARKDEEREARAAQGGTDEGFDSIVIGSGAAGIPLAIALAKSGRPTALIEKGDIGGSSINATCLPLKTMQATARMVDMVKNAPELGVNVLRQPTIADMKAIQERKTSFVRAARKKAMKDLAAAGVRVFEGEAAFSDPWVISVKMNQGNTITLNAQDIFINTGVRPTIPDYLHIDADVDASRVLDWKTCQDLDVVPPHLIVLGGGPIGAELAHMFRRLGSGVTIVASGPRLMAGEDVDVSEALQRLLEQDGCYVHLNAIADGVSAGADQPIEVHCMHHDGQPWTVHGSHVLVAMSSRPNTDGLNLGPAAVWTTDDGYIRTNDYLQTTMEHIWAMGDVKEGPASTSTAYDDYRIIADNIINLPFPHDPDLNKPLRSTHNRNIPTVVNTDPPLVRTGLTEEAARIAYPERGQVMVATIPMAAVARAVQLGETRGFMKAIIETQTGALIGFACLGVEATEALAAVLVVQETGVGWRALRDMIFAHPSVSEGLNQIWDFFEPMPPEIIEAQMARGNVMRQRVAMGPLPVPIALQGYGHMVIGEFDAEELGPDFAVGPQLDVQGEHAQMGPMPPAPVLGDYDRVGVVQGEPAHMAILDHYPYYHAGDVQGEPVHMGAMNHYPYYHPHGDQGVVQGDRAPTDEFDPAAFIPAYAVPPKVPGRLGQLGALPPPPMIRDYGVQRDVQGDGAQAVPFDPPPIIRNYGVPGNAQGNGAQTVPFDSTPIIRDYAVQNNVQADHPQMVQVGPPLFLHSHGVKGDVEGDGGQADDSPPLFALWDHGA